MEPGFRLCPMCGQPLVGEVDCLHCGERFHNLLDPKLLADFQRFHSEMLALSVLWFVLGLFTASLGLVVIATVSGFGGPQGPQVWQGAASGLALLAASVVFFYATWWGVRKQARKSSAGGVALLLCVVATCVSLPLGAIFVLLLFQGLMVVVIAGQLVSTMKFEARVQRLGLSAQTGLRDHKPDS